MYAYPMETTRLFKKHGLFVAVQKSASPVLLFAVIMAMLFFLSCSSKPARQAQVSAPVVKKVPVKPPKESVVKAAIKKVSEEKFLSAAQSGDDALVLAAIKSGVNINATDKDGETALMKASFFNQPKVVNHLVDAGADVNIANNKGQTALILAAYEGNPEIIEKLLSAKPNVNAADNDGWTSLMMASMRDKKEAAKLLEKSGASYDPVSKAGNTVSSIAEKKQSNKILEMIPRKKNP